MKKIYLVLAIATAIVLLFIACEETTTDPDDKFSAPVIVSIVPNSGTIGDIITINGQKFGKSKGSSKIKFNEIEAVSFPVWNDTLIEVIVPANTISGPVTVIVNGKISNEVYFTIELQTPLPYISYLDPEYGSIGDEVIIYGSNLGSTQDQSIVSFNGALVTDYIVWSDTLINVIVPETAKSGPLTVIVNSNVSNEVNFNIGVFCEILGKLYDESYDTLRISKRNIDLLPDCICKMTNLKLLDLRENIIASLPECFGNLINLERLFLSDNQITNLPETLGNLINLEVMALDGNSLISLQESIGNWTNLNSLYLNRNQLKNLPESIGNLINMEQLFVMSNSLSSLPESFGNLTSLIYLKLNNNKLTSLPESIGNLENLEWLHLDDNQLTELPETIGNLKNLKTLSLQNNALTSLPQSISNLSLQFLYLKGNSFSSSERSKIKDSLPGTQIFY